MSIQNITNNTGLKWLSIGVLTLSSMACFKKTGGQPDDLPAATGLTDLYLYVDTYNSESLHWDGTTVTVTAGVSDHSHNPAPDGVAINFVTEYGVIQPVCYTVDGFCSVTWTSQEPRSHLPDLRKTLGDAECHYPGLGEDEPCPYTNWLDQVTAGTGLGGLGQVYGNRNTITAFTLGDEGWADVNSNGYYDVGENFVDRTETFTDYNGDKVFGGRTAEGDIIPGASSEAEPECYPGNNPYPNCYQPGGDQEMFFDFNGNERFDQGNGIYNGLACRESDAESGLCTRDGVNLSRKVEIVMSGSYAHIGILDNHTGSAVIDASANSNQTTSALVSVADIHNGVMPAGTIIEVSTDNGEITSESVFTIPNDYNAYYSTFTIDLVSDGDSSSGLLTVTVTTPNNVVTSKTAVFID